MNLEVSGAAFDRMVSHMLTQRKPCVDAYGECKYRLDGLKCAVGALIPDHLYSPSIEDNQASAIMNYLAPEFREADPTFLDMVQDMHDRWADRPREEWVSQVDSYLTEHAIPHNAENWSALKKLILAS